MPSANHETTIARQWELLKRLPSRKPGKTSRELRDLAAAAGHEVTKRTIERDLSELSRVFPIMSNEISIPFGWYWKPGARVDFPGIDLAEAVSLGLLENILRQLVPPTFLEALEGRFDEAREKLHALPQNPYAKWTDLVRYITPGMPFMPPAIRPEVMRSVQDALLRQRQLKVAYTSAGAADPKELLLHPIALIQQGVRPYLLADAFDYGQPRLYALQRMSGATLLDEAANRPKAGSLDAFLAQGGAQFGQGGNLTLKATLAEHLADILRETPLSDDQKITTRAGKHTLTATVMDSWQLQFWILSQGPAITVTAPVALRKRIHQQLGATVANYGPPAPISPLPPPKDS